MTRQKITDYALAAVLAMAVLILQSCTDDDDGSMQGAACSRGSDVFAKCVETTRPRPTLHA
jgi:hypothetical protein